ncbi:MAG TPA: 2-succinyl-6-hydroxy-2,4-cyclohexadiene-1-carboxylate synthase [Solirubrobacteraceae bacterium]
MAVMMVAMAPTLVLLHGFTHTGRSWDPVVAALGERYRALAPDIRGHGRAASREPVTLEGVIEDVAESGGEAFTLAGYSMGGRIALHVAAALPGRVERLVLVGASPGIADDAERTARREADERLADEIEGMDIEAFALRWASNPLLAGQPAWVQEDRLRNDPVGLARALRGLGTGALVPLWERLGELRMPIALVVGDRDVKFRTIAEEIAESIAHANVVLVPNAGHAVHLEAPQAVAEAIAGR